MMWWCATLPMWPWKCVCRVCDGVEKRACLEIGLCKTDLYHACMSVFWRDECVCLYTDRFFGVVQHAPHRVATPRAQFQLRGLDGSIMRDYPWATHTVSVWLTELCLCVCDSASGTKISFRHLLILFLTAVGVKGHPQDLLCEIFHEMSFKCVWMLICFVCMRACVHVCVSFVIGRS